MTEEKKEKPEEKTISPKITEICLAGGCNRGISYIGCFKKLEEHNLLGLKKIVGVSIGSFIGACYMLGYSSDELLETVIDKNMNEFKDFSISEPSAILKGVQYKNWVYEVLEKKVDPNITLKQLFEKTGIEFTTTTTCIHSQSEDFSEGIVYLSHVHTPEMTLYTAVNCSMAFPFVFPPMIYKDCHFIDGGVLDNFPMDLLSIDAIGIKVNFKPSDSLTSTKNPISYIGKMFELMANRFKVLKNEPHQNIITVDCDDFDVIELGMSIDDKITLYKRGYKAMTRFIENNPNILEPIVPKEDVVIDNFNTEVSTEISTEISTEVKKEINID
jgi:NTE family protein